MLLLTGGCSLGGSPASSSGNATLTVGIPAPLGSIDPSKDNSYDLQSIIRYLANDPIVQVNTTNGSFGPALATDFGFVGTGNKTWQFTLRKDARFSDGTPVNASSVKAWIDHYVATGRSGKVPSLDNSLVEAVDEWTVRVTANQPEPNIPFYLSGQQWGFVSSLANPSILSRQSVGSGPYVMVASETISGDHYTFVPNKGYRDQSKIKWGKIVAKVISTTETMLQAAQSGQVDVAFGDPSTVAAAETAGLKVSWASQGWSGIEFLGRVSKPLADARVRQALNYAIDRKAITQAMVGKYGEPTSEWLTSDGFDPAYQNYYSYQPDKAKALLADAGYANGFTLRIIDEGFVGNLGDPMVQAVAKYLNAVGVTVKVTTAATPDEFFSKAFTGQFDAIAFPMGINPSGDSWWGVKQFAPPDAELERLGKIAVVAPVGPASVDAWTQLVRRTVTQAFMLPVMTTPAIVYSSKKVGGVSVTRFFRFGPVMLDWYPQ
jgi:peptide/nickel transport system substrate-binding protein